MAATEERSNRSPLFARLPPGRQQLDRAHVRRNQWLRLCGAMAAAVADEGYQTTTISRIAGLAGVSRKAFYEHFPDKDACLDAIVDELAAELQRRLIAGATAADDGVEQRLAGALEAACELLASRPTLLGLLLEASRATPSARARCRMLLDELTRIAAWTLADAPEGVLPPLLLRGVVRGAATALITPLRDPRCGEPSQVRAQITAWILALQTAQPPAPRPGVHEAPTAMPRPAAPAHRDERRRVLVAALRASTATDPERRTALAIADYAQVSPETVLELYPDVRRCYQDARELAREEILSTVNLAARGPIGVVRLRQSLGALVAYLGTDRGRGSRALEDGPECDQRAFRHMLALTLCCAAGVEPPSETIGEALATAVWSIAHACSCRSPRHRAAVIEQLAFLILASVHGGERAAAHAASAGQREPGA